MALTRRTESSTWMDPWKELDEMMGKRLSRLFEGRELVGADWAPAVDVTESETEYRIRAALPDVKKEDVKVQLENGILSIRGERKSRKEEKNEKVHRVEIAQGSFMRTFTMPDDVDAEKVQAKYENGMLEVAIAKAPRKPSTGREIAIR